MNASFSSRALRAAEARILPDKIYVQRDFKKKTGLSLNIANPTTFREKIQWLKLYHRDPLMTTCADKVEVKNFIKENIGEDYAIQSLAIFEKDERIDLSPYSPPMILKATHGSGWNYFATKLDEQEKEHIQEYFRKWLRKNYYLYSREWAYKGVRPRVLCEPLLTDSEGSIPNDYKVFCFNGHAQLIQVDHDRFSEHKRAFFDREWHRKNFTIGYPISHKEIPKPDNLNIVLDVSEKVAQSFPFVRVDFLLSDNLLKINELTFYPGNGMSKYSDLKWDSWMGSLLRL